MKITTVLLRLLFFIFLFSIDVFAQDVKPFKGDFWVEGKRSIDLYQDGSFLIVSKKIPNQSITVIIMSDNYILYQEFLSEDDYELFINIKNIDKNNSYLVIVNQDGAFFKEKIF